jgi:uncharacterized hydrophobic protein (TIGR00271 family)
MSRANTNYVMLVVLAAALASFGLLQSSAAVIIGAMLVAPLMSPLMGLGLGLAQSDLSLMRTSLWTVTIGILSAFSISLVLGLIAPLKTPTLEMQARGNPTLLDMGVALASGVAGAFALARKDIPAAIAGVAIAAALMPPVCTSGLALGFGDVALSSKAGLLFVLNLIGISLAAFGTFAWMGLHPPPHRRYWRQAMIALISLAALAAPLTLALREVTQRGVEQVAVQESLEDSLPGWDVTDVEIEDSDPVEVIATVRGTETLRSGDISAAEEALEKELKRSVTLKIVVEKLLAPDEEPGE